MDKEDKGFNRWFLAGLGIIFGLPIIGGILSNIVEYKHEEKMTKYLYKDRDKRIDKLQKNGAQINVNLDGEI